MTQCVGRSGMQQGPEGTAGVPAHFRRDPPELERAPSRHPKYFDRLYFLQLNLFHSTSFNCLNVARYKFGAVENFREKYLFFHFENSSKIKIYLLQRVHGGTFGNESLLKKTAAERQLQRLRKRKESTSSTTAQQSRRMDASTQTIVRLALVASPLELKTPSYKLLLIVKKKKLNKQELN
ncbi:hypothetical protein AGLY_017842 [Aphis glycines]|uniref:Uncharacterized protein n=1 Tax=Aphis glycines TaxID=307491 RepID=A0A6G0SUJ1_APHGL|nr:hypothetical protein AGLY_017842 [Aphis glycines]